MNIAENIKAIANQHGKTISQLAQELGVAQSQLSRTINNERITLKDLSNLSEKIGCNITDFFAEDSNTLICPHCGKEIHIKIE